MQTNDHFEYTGFKELECNEIMKNFNNFIVKKALIYAKKNFRIIDFGAGIGTLSLIFRKFGINTKCIEIDKINQEYLKNRGFEVYKSLKDVKEKSNIIFSSNVLEHIEDDLLALMEMSSHLKNNGYIFLFLPAKQILYNSFDLSVGHYRRYELSDLKIKCKNAGFNIIRSHYVDSLGFFATLLVKIIGYNSEGGIVSKKSLKFYDTWIFPVSLFLDNIGLKFFFGKNIILVGQKI